MGSQTFGAHSLSRNIGRKLGQGATLDKSMDSAGRSVIRAQIKCLQIKCLSLYAPSEPYRAEIKAKLDGGDMRGAMATEIRDVRRAAQEISGDRTKYNGAMREMMDDSRQRGLIPEKTQKK